MELDPTSFPAWRDRIDAAPDPAHEPRSYPGYPTAELPRYHKRWLGRTSLDEALTRRRSARELSTTQPTAAQLGAVLHLAHGITGDAGRGPNPSAGGLQAIELYVSSLVPGWLDGAYHFDRAAHRLARVTGSLSPDLVPALVTMSGGAALVIVVGDRGRVATKYGDRASRFLLLEAGHVMQSLCLAAVAADVRIVPLGGFFERPIAAALALPKTDDVLYCAVVG